MTEGTITYTHFCVNCCDLRQIKKMCGNEKHVIYDNRNSHKNEKNSSSKFQIKFILRENESFNDDRNKKKTLNTNTTRLPYVKYPVNKKKKPSRKMNDEVEETFPVTSEFKNFALLHNVLYEMKKKKKFLLSKEAFVLTKVSLFIITLAHSTPSQPFLIFSPFTTKRNFLFYSRQGFSFCLF